MESVDPIDWSKEEARIRLWGTLSQLDLVEKFVDDHDYWCCEDCDNFGWGYTEWDDEDDE